MRRRRPNPRLVKLHRSYTVEEVARVFPVHKNTVRAWIKLGLPVVDDRRPALITGRELRNFLEAKRKKRKQPCPPGHLYCVRCRAPKAPAGGMADYLPITSTSGNLRGLCPDCGTLIHRRVSRTQLDEFRAFLDITIPQALPRIRESTAPSMNCDSSRDDRADENAQP